MSTGTSRVADVSGGSKPVVVREASDRDWAGMWPIIAEVARAGETFAMEAAPDEASARAEWLTPAPGRVVVACDLDGVVLGTANMYANRPAQGSHVASGSVMVAGEARGRGVGRALVREMIDWAVRSRFVGIQFNAVVETNTAAVRLYESEGFIIIGTVPGAFQHPDRGPVGLHIMWRPISE